MSPDPGSEAPPVEEPGALRSPGERTEAHGSSAVRRLRRTRQEIEDLRFALRSIVEDTQPCTARSVYYVGIGPGLWPKDQGGSRRSYNDVIRNLGIMREAIDRAHPPEWAIPWGWLTDATRYVVIDTMYDSLDDALDRWSESYRRQLWADQPRRIEVWCESDSTRSLIEPVTRTLGVGAYSCRGQAGKEFVHQAASVYRHIGKPVTILYVGDWDPSGLAIERSLEARLRRYSNDEVDITFERFAVTPSDIDEMGLQRHEVNTADKNYARFAEECRLVGLAPQDAVELEAMPPPVLRQRLEDALYDLVDDAATWNATLAAEQSEREILTRIATRDFAGMDL